jgi:hypothetical protein
MIFGISLKTGVTPGCPKDQQNIFPIEISKANGIPVLVV